MQLILLLLVVKVKGFATSHKIEADYRYLVWTNTIINVRFNVRSVRLWSYRRRRSLVFGGNDG